MTLTLKSLSCILMAAADLASHPLAAGKPPATDRAAASFELEVVKSQSLKKGISRMQCQSASASLLSPGRLQVRLPAKPLKDSGTPETGDHAVLTLLLDKDHRVSQADLLYVIPGTSVGRTIAWKPEDLQHYFAQARYAGDRLVLKSKGSYRDADSEADVAALAWDVDLDLPVAGSSGK